MILGRYEVVGHLAAGGMAEVLLARLRGPSGFERPVVLKRILPHLARATDFREMFLDEARLVAKIRHPNVVHVSELAEEAGELYLAMEYLEGESLAGLQRRLTARGERLSFELAAHIVAEACAGLHAAHELVGDSGEPLSIVHRDVSPQNVFVTYGGDVKVLDFGIAKAHGQESRTEAGQTKGKLEYMSPEQCLGLALDRRSDVFSLGVVLYEVLTGRRLFKRATPLLSLEAIVREPVIPPSRVIDGVPADLDRIVLRCLARERDARYASAAEVRRDLVAFEGATAPGRTLDEELAARMQELFDDRRRDKDEMLRRVRAGSDLSALPPAEADETVELPVVTPATIADSPGVGAEAQPAGRRRASPAWTLAIVAAASVAVALAVAVHRGSVPGAGRVTASAPASSGDLAATSSSAAAAATATATAQSADAGAAATIALSIESRPAAASVFVDGEPRGQTPAELTLPRGDAPRRIELRKEGFETLTDSVVPIRDQSLRATLTPRSAQPPKRSSPARRKNPLDAKW